MTARALLDRNPDPSDGEIREAISGQICRCTGYATIVRSVQWAADHERGRADAERRRDAPRPIRGRERVMTTVEDQPARVFDDNDQKPVGHGRMLRKEDPRFVRGKGRYVDDIQLPGMLHLAILRSPVAHARIVSIDTSAAEAHPKVKAVVTGAMLAEQRAGLDADPVQRRAGGAGHRQGPLPGPGGRLRRRRGPVRGPGRARADRRRVRHPAARHRRPPGARPGRAGDPRRPRGQDRQPLLRLGDRRRGRHRGGVRPGRRRGQPGHRLPAGAPGADGDLRRGRRLRPRSTASSPSGRRRRRRTRTARSTRSSPACPSTRSGSSRRTSAAGSATRCRSTPATSARSSPRS